jgi:Cell division protein
VDHNTPMTQPAEHSFELAPEPETVAYEQPLNERMRTFLRLEFLYTQALYHGESPQPLSTRAGVTSLLEILAITGRSDTRNDVLKELERQAQLMKEFQSRPGVDPARLRSVLSNLLRLRDELSAAGAQFMAPLRDSEFLSAIKRHSGRHLRFRFAGLFVLAQPAGRHPRARVCKLDIHGAPVVRRHRGVIVAHARQCPR